MPKTLTKTNLSPLASNLARLGLYEKALEFLPSVARAEELAAWLRSLDVDLEDELLLDDRVRLGVALPLATCLASAPWELPELLALLRELVRDEARLRRRLGRDVPA